MGVIFMPKKKYFFITLSLLCFLPAAALCQLCPTESDDGEGYCPWPMFHFDLRHTGKTDNFGTQVGALKWTFVTNGPVTSSPAIRCEIDEDCYESCTEDETQGTDPCVKKCQDCTVYIGSADNNFYAIDAETGALEWKYTTGGAVELSSPAIDEDGFVYVGSNDGHLYAFDTETIDPLDPDYTWRFQTNGAVSSSPSIDVNGNILFTSADGYLYAVDPTGNLDWSTRIGSSWCSPAIDTSSDQVYVGSWLQQEGDCEDIELDNDTTITVCEFVNFFALDSSDGDIEWSFPSFCTPGGILASPTIASDQSVIVSFFMTYSSDCDDEESDFHIWSLDPDGNANWGLQLGGKNDIYTTPAMLEDNSFFIASASDIYRVVPDGQTYLTSPGDGQRIESSPAIDGGKLIFFGSNGGRVYAICADCPETPILWQYPAADDDPLQQINVNGTISIASVISSPAIGNDSRHSIYVGASDGNVYAFYDGLRISGSVFLVDSDTQTDADTKTPLRAVKMTLTSEFSATERVTYTDTNGNYEFAGIDENITYTVTPEKIGYIFNPASKDITIKQNQDATDTNFDALIGFTVSGSVKDSDGDGLGGVTITLDGEKTIPETTTTDSTGSYSFTGLSFDTYTITPSFDGYGFDPSFEQIAIDSDTNGLDFTATKGYQISGIISNITTGNPLEEEVTVLLSGDASDSTTTNENGSYTFLGLENGSYTITPSPSEFNFEPESQSVTIASGNELNVDFDASRGGGSISGFIEFDEASTDNATIEDIIVDLFQVDLNRLSNIFQQEPVQADQKPLRSVQPDSNGFFIFIGIEQDDYLIKPRLSGYGFEPSSRSVTLRTTKIEKQIFSAVAGLYISGRVTNYLSLPQPGVTLSIEGLENTTAVTFEDGIYTFTGLDPGTYTVSVIQEGYESRPASQAVQVYGSGEENVDFTIRAVCPEVYAAIPPAGPEGTLVNIVGINFGTEEPPEDLTFQVGASSVSLSAGVYFGNTDPETWVKAEVSFWSPVKIDAKAPAGLGLVSIWVLNETGCTYIPPRRTNKFILTTQ